MSKEKRNNDYIVRFNNGETIWNIAKCEKKTYKQVYEAISGRRFEARFLPQEEKDNICNLYLNGYSTVAIGKKYGVNNKTVAIVLEEKKIQRDRKKFIRKYSLNEHYFDKIDTQKKAYILGLLYADGNNCKQKSTVRIQLQEQDVHILQEICKELNYNKPLSYIDCSKRVYGNNYVSSNMYSLDIYSKYMCDQLEKLGMIPNKSLVLTFPSFLSNEFIPHFLRGYIDGDGHISKASYICNLTSTVSFCQSVQDYVYKNLGLLGGIKDASCHNGMTKVFYFSRKEEAKQFLDYIYKDATIYLNRKYNLYRNRYYNINNSLLA